MSLKVLKKDINLLLRNKSALIAILTIYGLETVLLVYLGNSAEIAGKSRTAAHFVYMQNFVLISYFPVITSIILVLSFSLTKEKKNFMLARLIPFGESIFMRSKVHSATLLGLVTAMPFLFVGIFFCGLDTFYNLSFLAATVFYLLFFITSLSIFSVSYAVNYFNPATDFQPGLKGITGLMFFISLFVIVSFLGYSRMLGFYYSYVSGFRRDYPNKECLMFIVSAFIFLVMTRYILNLTEKKLTGNYLNNK